MDSNVAEWLNLIFRWLGQIRIQTLAAMMVPSRPPA